jgi:hypothetical protein
MNQVLRIYLARLVTGNGLFLMMSRRRSKDGLVTPTVLEWTKQSCTKTYPREDSNNALNYWRLIFALVPGAEIDEKDVSKVR